MKVRDILTDEVVERLAHIYAKQTGRANPRAIKIVAADACTLTLLAFRQAALEPLPSSAHYLEHDTQAASNGVVLYFNSAKDALAFLDNLTRLASPTPSTNAQEEP